MKYAGFWRRFLAMIIDSILIGIVNGVIAATIFQDLPVARTLITIVIAWSYLVYFIGSRGQTLGKMALGIKVVDMKGKKVDYKTALLRETVGKFISGIVIDLGYLWMLWDKNKQTWHDKIAKTVVVKA